MSAYLPTSSEPVTSSANSCHAASMVCARIACSTVSRSSGPSTRPLGAVRVIATLMLRSGSSGVTGGSLCSEMRMPVLTAEPHGIHRSPCSGPNKPVDDDVAPIVDLVDEQAARHPEVMGALQLLVPDRADVLEPQPVVVARPAP